tara:strand:- start:551 stop:691 length:141 start_codon:yes stop_codon:yes gene_type:complete
MITSTKKLDKINTYKRLKFFVYKGLLKGWGPNQIHGDEKINTPMIR